MPKQTAAPVIIEPVSTQRALAPALRPDRLSTLEHRIDLLADRLEQLEFTIAQAFFEAEDSPGPFHSGEARGIDPMQAACDRIAATLLQTFAPQAQRRADAWAGHPAPDGMFETLNGHAAGDSDVERRIAALEALVTANATSPLFSRRGDAPRATTLSDTGVVFMRRQQAAPA